MKPVVSGQPLSPKRDTMTTEAAHDVLIPTRRTTLRKTVQCMAVLKRQSSCGGWKKTGRFQFTDVTNKNMRFIHIWLVVYLPL